MPSPFDTCRDRIARAEFHRQSLIDIWNNIDTDKVYASSAKIHRDGTGQYFMRMAEQDWLLPFSLQLGEMLYQLRSALDSCVYDAAILKFGQDPPPYKEKWEFVFGANPGEFDEAVRRMKKILPNDIRALIEAVQPYGGTSAIHDGMTWDVGNALMILNDWARIDRHRRLHLVGTAIVAADMRIGVPEGMSIEHCNFTVGDFLLEHDSEVAAFKIRNYVSGTKVHMQPKVAFDIAVDETPRVTLREISFAMLCSVSFVRRRFEEHFGIYR